MPDTVGAIKNLFLQIEKYIPESFEWDSNLKYVIAGLGTKALSNCHVAKELALQACLGEALIILRSAYETVVIMHYLIQHPDEVSRYQNHSRLIEYKDRLAAFERNPEFKDLPEPMAILNQFKKEIQDKELLKEPSFFKRTNYQTRYRQLFEDESILDNSRALAESITVYFADPWSMTDELFKDMPDIYQNLKDANSIVYNLGSQLSHAYWCSILDLYLRTDGNGNVIEPEVDQDRIFIGIAMISDFAIGGLIEAEILPSMHSDLKSSFGIVASELSEAIELKSQELNIGSP